MLSPIQVGLILVALALLIVLLGVVVLQRRKSGRMPPEFQLNPGEEKAVMAYPYDGIADIYIGLLIMLFGLFLFTDMPWLAGAVVVTFIPLYQASKRAYTAPRIGQIAFTPSRRGDGTAVVTVLLVMGVAALVFGVLVFGLTNAGSLPMWLGAVLFDYGAVTAGAAGALLWVIAAYFDAVNRYYLYAAVTLALAAIGFLYSLPFALGVTLLGAIVFCAGLMTLYQFVHRYPTAAEM
jgi:hypothetical protein